MQDPVVKGRDRSLDVTRCKGRFILEVPPGAERGFGGERQLRADLDYTAQASADGAGFVYQQKGAEPIVAMLAAFNLGTGAYRPPPAIDEAQAPAELDGRTTVAEPTVAPPASGRPAEPRPAVLPRKPAPSAPPKPLARTEVADRTATEPRQPAPTAAGSRNSEATVRAFYGALGAGNGAAASSQVIPEKRSSGAFSAGAISRFYGRLPEPLKLTGIEPLASGAYRVKLPLFGRKVAVQRDRRRDTHKPRRARPHPINSGTERLLIPVTAGCSCRRLLPTHCCRPLR